MATSQRKSNAGPARVGTLLVALLLLSSPAASSDPAGRGAPAGGASINPASASPSSSAAGAPSARVEGYTAAAPQITGQGSDAAPVEVRTDSAPGARAVTTIHNDPRCGRGFTSVAGAGKSTYRCFHSALDPMPPAVSTPMARAAGAPPACQGNGVNGPRIQLLYMYVEGQPDRTAQVVPRIVNQIVPRMEAVYRETSKLQGREIGMRLHMPGCKLAVDTLKIDSDNGAPGDPFVMIDRITEAVSQAGYSTSDRKYVLWFDGGNEGACGIAPAQTTRAAHVTDNAVTGNIANIGWQALLPETAVIFRYGVPILGNAPPQVGECWGRGGTGARTEIHELTHLLGAVNLSAPNSNGAGHCTDDHDIMCYGEKGVATVPRCATRVEQLDCGADDYFNARPQAGSYLSTHWNTANSRFLGEAPVHDAVPVDIPRP